MSDDKADLILAELSALTALVTRAMQPRRRASGNRARCKVRPLRVALTMKQIQALLLVQRFGPGVLSEPAREMNVSRQAFAQIVTRANETLGAIGFDNVGAFLAARAKRARPSDATRLPEDADGRMIDIDDGTHTTKERREFPRRTDRHG